MRDTWSVGFVDDMAMHADMEAQRFCEQLYQAIILIFSVLLCSFFAS
jgi:hypothetical protein